MIPATTFAGRRVAVVGLGASGLATAGSLVAGGAEVVTWDDGAGARDAATRSGFAVADLSEVDWTGFAALVLAPGIPLTHPEPHWSVRAAIGAGVEVIGDIELFFRERARLAQSSPVVAITGTNGKSTTTALVAHLLRAAGRDVEMGGNIGKAILTLAPPAPNRVHVIEMSSFQIDLTPSLAPSIGVLLNLSPDHLDRHGDMHHYAAVKRRLAIAAAHAVIGIDDDWCRAIANDRIGAGGSTEMISIAGPVTAGLYADGSRILCRDGSGAPIVIADLAGIGTLRGSHNAQNAAAACAVALRLGVPRTALLGLLATFPGLPHRMEEVGRRRHVLFINDSKATNADSTEKALASWTAGIHWIVGGKPKDGGIRSLEAYFARIARAYLIGASAEEFAETLSGKVPIVHCGTLEVALRQAIADASGRTDGEAIVLLSPACASYDQFRSFEHRGDRFRALVREHLEGLSRDPKPP